MFMAFILGLILGFTLSAINILIVLIERTEKEKS
jgi:hypothetical protein